MKCNELLRLLMREGWTIVSQRVSHVKLNVPSHPEKGIIIFPNHGSAELGKGLELKIKKQAGLK